MVSLTYIFSSSLGSALTRIVLSPVPNLFEILSLSQALCDFLRTNLLPVSSKSVSFKLWLKILCSLWMFSLYSAYFWSIVSFFLALGLLLLGEGGISLTEDSGGLKEFSKLKSSVSVSLRGAPQGSLGAKTEGDQGSWNSEFLTVVGDGTAAAWSMALKPEGSLNTDILLLFDVDFSSFNGKIVGFWKISLSKFINDSFLYVSDMDPLWCFFSGSCGRKASSSSLRFKRLSTGILLTVDLGVSVLLLLLSVSASTSFLTLKKMLSIGSDCWLTPQSLFDLIMFISVTGLSETSEQELKDSKLLLILVPNCASSVNAPCNAVNMRVEVRRCFSSRVV